MFKQWTVFGDLESRKETNSESVNAAKLSLRGKYLLRNITLLDR